MTRRSTPWSRHLVLPAVALAALLLAAPAADAFCGFYVAKASTDLWNEASKVVLVRDGDRTVMTMANDYRGEPAEFALVVPVPTVLQRGQIHVGDPAVLDHLDAYTAPRLVEYFDEDPCRPRVVYEMMPAAAAPDAVGSSRVRAKQLGVTIEAEYTVGEYDVVILSAEESSGLETWLRESGYRIPEGAGPILGSYLKQGLRFFVAKVNLAEQARLGYAFLRPLQIAYESPRFMLPIRLGTVNAAGAQELFVFVLTRDGRVETTNYRTVKLPSDVEVPEFVEAEFADFYRDMFRRQVEKERMSVVFLEYAWDMSWCDPCAADPLSDVELRQLGVWWGPDPGPEPRPLRPRPPQPAPGPAAARDVFVTRLHVRYTAESFPEDLRFQATGDRTNFQGRYVIQRPWKGSPDECPEARDYFRELARRQDRRAEDLARLTGWELTRIRDRMGDVPTPPDDDDDDRPWWQRLWGDDDEEGGR